MSDDDGVDDDVCSVLSCSQHKSVLCVLGIEKKPGGGGGTLELGSALTLSACTILAAGPVTRCIRLISSVQGRAETFGGAGAQNIKGAHETRL